MRSLILLLLSCVTALLLKTDSTLSDAGTPSHPALAALPANMVWAWERPEDLRWLPDDVGVAYVASTVMLRGEEALVHPRTAQLLVREATPLVPVLHIDASWRLPPALSEQQTSRIAQELLRVAQRGNRHVVQLDFEVRRSQRAFLAATISAIRSRLDPSIALSVTALASWCLEDTWMQGSAADEIVPMAFRMGQEEQALRRRLAQQQGFKPAYCRSAVGFATDEPILNLRNKRRYYFSPTAWTADKWQATQHPLQTNATPSQPQFLTASQ